MKSPVAPSTERGLTRVGGRARSLERRYIPAGDGPDQWPGYTLGIDDTQLGDLSVHAGVGAFKGGDTDSDEGNIYLAHALLAGGIRPLDDNGDLLLHRTVLGNLTAIVNDASALVYDDPDDPGEWRVIPTWSTDYEGNGPYFIVPSDVGSGEIVQASVGGAEVDFPRWPVRCKFDESKAYIVMRLADGSRVNYLNPIPFANGDRIELNWLSQTAHWD